MIWASDFLQQLATDAESSINVDLPVIYQKFYLPVTQGISVYTLPSFVRSVERVTWRGRALDGVSWEELQFLTPATYFQSLANREEASQSTPLYYAMHPTNPYDIRLYPCPNISLLDFTGLDPYGQTANEPACCISCMRNTDTSGNDATALLPVYIDRRTRKAYVLWKSFEAEGKGQNLRAATYYKKKYAFLISQFTAINSGCYVGKRYMVEDGMITIDGFRYPRPMLPSNFERVYF